MASEPSQAFWDHGRTAKSQPGALHWQISENGTYPDFDLILATCKGELPTLDSQACEVCRQITISDLSNPNPPYGYKHHQSETALIASANKGCRLCIWVCHALFFEPQLEGTVEKWATRAPEFRRSRYRYPPILRFSASRKGITVRPSYEETERNILRVYTSRGVCLK